MNLDFENMDKLFRDELGDFTQQPSPGLWKKISGRLFWIDLIRFNFVNLPKVWIGSAIAAIFLTSLFFIIPTPEPENSLTTENYIYKSDDSPIANKTSSQSVPSIHKRKLPPTTLVSETSITNQVSSLDEIVITSPNKKSQNISGTPILKIQELQKTDSTQNQIQENGLLAQNKGLKQSSIAEDNQTFSSSKAQSQKQHSSKLGLPLVLQSKNSLQTETSQEDKVEQNSLSPGNVPSLSGGAFVKDMKSSQENIQKINSRTFSFDGLFKEKYKPPKRDFRSMPNSIYREKNTYFSVAMYFAPEVTAYTRIASESREFNYTVGISANYYSSNFVVQGGLELSYFNDVGDYLVNLSTFDSIGYYNGVSGFEIDPEDPGSIVFDTDIVTVMDSVEHHSHQQTPNNYTYLQVPLMMGYKAVENGIFTAYIKAGPGFSFLLNRKEPSLNITASDANIDGIENYSTPRSNASVQILFSVDLHFRINENWGVLIEPTYRYYLNSVYDLNNATVKNSYGIGVKGGLYYNFN